MSFTLPGHESPVEAALDLTSLLPALPRTAPAPYVLRLGTGEQ